MPDPAAPAAVAERTLRSAPTPVSIAQLKVALLNLATRCDRAERDLPRVGVVMLGQNELSLVLTDDDPDPIPPFVAIDSRRWTATTTDIAGDQRIEDDWTCPEPYPALVTVGHTESATVILNLEAAGTLAVVGDPHGADEVLRALVADLASSELSGRVGIACDESFADLAAAFEVHQLQVEDGQRSTRATWAEAITDALAAIGADDTLEARTDRIAEDTWLPNVYVEATTPSTAASRPWSGCVLLTRTSALDGWTLTVGEDGAACLEPAGLRLTPQRLSAVNAESLTSMLVTALPPADPRELPHGAQPSDELPGEIRALSSSLTSPSASTHGALERSPGAARLHVLGPIEITGIPTPGARISPMTTELLIYLGLHGRASGPELDEILWNGRRVASSTRNALIYRARKRVGADVLPLADEAGRFSLGPGARTDWEEFQARVRTALESDDDQSALLTSALDLIRGRPFLGIAPADYAWAEPDVQQMIATITDTTHILARLHLDASNPRDALAAAMRGLAVDPYAERLQQDAIDAVTARGDEREADRLRTRFDDVLADLDADLR